LPKAWAEDDERRRKAKVPEDIVFKTKPEIALDHIRWAHEIGLPGKMVLMDAGYGNDSKLRTGVTELGLSYVAGIQAQTLVWKPGIRPGLPPKKGRRDAPNTTSVKELALSLKAKAWRTIKWREGTNEWLSSRFARVRVHVASSHERRGKPAAADHPRLQLHIRQPERRSRKKPVTGGTFQSARGRATISAVHCRPSARANLMSMETRRGSR